MNAVKLSRLLTALGVAALATPAAHAGIDYEDRAELVFVLWDKVAKVAYSKDLGVNNYIGADPALRRASFFVYAQQDAGSAPM
jgi:hypothetical protein